MLKRYLNSVEIMASTERTDLLMQCMTTPTMGRVKSACEAVYNKQQGRFYGIEIQGQTVGILGYRIIDRTCELIHLFYKEDMLSTKDFRGYIHEALSLDGLTQMQMIVHEQDKAFYTALGFICKPHRENDLGFNQISCILKSGQ